MLNICFCIVLHFNHCSCKLPHNCIAVWKEKLQEYGRYPTTAGPQLLLPQLSCSSIRPRHFCQPFLHPSCYDSSSQYIPTFHSSSNTIYHCYHCKEASLLVLPICTTHTCLNSPLIVCLCFLLYTRLVYIVSAVSKRIIHLVCVTVYLCPRSLLNTRMSLPHFRGDYH